MDKAASAAGRNRCILCRNHENCIVSSSIICACLMSSIRISRGAVLSAHLSKRLSIRLVLLRVQLLRQFSAFALSSLHPFLAWMLVNVLRVQTGLPAGHASAASPEAFIGWQRTSAARAAADLASPVSPVLSSPFFEPSRRPGLLALAGTGAEAGAAGAAPKVRPAPRKFSSLDEALPKQLPIVAEAMQTIKNKNDNWRC